MNRSIIPDILNHYNGQSGFDDKNAHFDLSDNSSDANATEFHIISHVELRTISFIDDGDSMDNPLILFGFGDQTIKKGDDQIGGKCIGAWGSLLGYQPRIITVFCKKYGKYNIVKWDIQKNIREILDSSDKNLKDVSLNPVHFISNNKESELGDISPNQLSVLKTNIPNHSSLNKFTMLYFEFDNIRYFEIQNIIQQDFSKFKIIYTPEINIQQFKFTIKDKQNEKKLIINSKDIISFDNFKFIQMKITISKDKNGNSYLISDKCPDKMYKTKKKNYGCG